MTHATCDDTGQLYWHGVYKEPIAARSLLRVFQATLADPSIHAIDGYPEIVRKIVDDLSAAIAEQDEMMLEHSDVHV